MKIQEEQEIALRKKIVPIVQRKGIFIFQIDFLARIIPQNLEWWNWFLVLCIHNPTIFGHAVQCQISFDAVSTFFMYACFLDDFSGRNFAVLVVPKSIPVRVSDLYVLIHR